MNEVEKLRYAVSYFDIKQMKPGARKIYDFFPDGRIIVKEYEPGSRKQKSNRSFQISPIEFVQMYENIKRCIDNAERLEQYVDDSDATLTIFHSFGRSESMQRGLGTRDETVGTIITDCLNRFE